jgi:uncharacterized protein (TIGR02145 family)
MKKVYLKIIIIALIFLASCEKEKPKPSDVSTQITIKTGTTVDIKYRSASVNGNLGETYNLTVQDYGHCWDTLANPVITKNKTSFGKQKGAKAFTSQLSNLQPGKQYYIRAFFAIDGIYMYSTSLIFNTKPTSVPSISTIHITDISATTATTGGIITDDGGFVISSRGVCWNKMSNPTIADKKTEQGAGNGNFTSYLKELSVSTTYYVRAYATNSIGIFYGTEVNFTTIDGIPKLTTTTITSIMATTATSGGNITDDGGLTIIERGVCWSTSPNPTVANSKSTDGSGSGIFISALSGLSVNTKYYIRAYATNSNGTVYGNEQTFTTDLPDISGETGTITDYDGNTYNWVGIGKQAWMAKNLKAAHYPDGTAIPLITDNTAWGNLGDNNTDDAYCYYNNNASGEAATYGALYTYAAAKDACPTGWHLPNITEWETLINFIRNDGHNGTEGTALKATSGWKGDGNGTDNYGFSALPGGFRVSSSGTFTFFMGGDDGNWWSFTEHSSSVAYFQNLHYKNADNGRSGDPKSVGFSVRCIRD